MPIKSVNIHKIGGLSIPIELPTKVTGEKLERTCATAAEEMGYKTRPEHVFSTRYSLGQFHRHEDYKKT